MNNSPDEHPLDELPNVLEACATSVPSVNQSLFKASFLRANDHQDVMERYILKSCKFGWKFHITKREKGKILFLFKKQDIGEFSVMKTKLNFRMSPTENPRYLNKTIPQPQYNWSPPSFIISDKEKIKEEAKKFDVDPEDCILLEVGTVKKRQLLIAFRVKEKNQKVKLKKTVFHYTDATNITGTFKKKMLFDFCDALKEGLQNGFEGGKPLQLSLNENNEVQNIIKQMYQCYQQMVFHAPPATLNKSWLRHGVLHYNIQDFVADVSLRLKADGTLAWEYAKDDPFQMQLNLTIQQQGRQPIVQVKTFPPDFLTGGTLYKKLMAAVLELDENKSKAEDAFVLERAEKEVIDPEEAAEEKDLKEQSPHEVIIQKFDKTGWNSETVVTILEQCREEGAVIFRINRKRSYDTNMFVLIGNVGTMRHALVFRGKFKVHFNNGEPEVSLLRKSSLKVLYNHEYQPINDGHRVEEYFTKLTWFLKSWVDMVDS